MKKKFSLFIYISLAFLIVALAKSDYLFLPVIFSIKSLSLSILALAASFFMFALRWKLFLDYSGNPVSYKSAVVSIGLSVFGRYIPGKVMLIVGQALYFKDKYGYSVKRITALATHNQLLELWVGLTLGSLPFLFISQKVIHPLLIVLFILLLSLAVFTRVFHQPFNYLISKFLKRQIIIPQLDFLSVVKVIPVTVVELLLKAAGFYFLLEATHVENFPLVVGLFFLLAQILGIMAIVAPGGIGVREGFIVAFLALVGVELKDSVAISVVSRLWYLSVESFFFIFAAVLKNFDNKTLKQQIPLEEVQTSI